MMNESIVFTAPWKVEVQQQPLDGLLQPHELLVEKIYSLISSGTELACLSGKEHWFKMPRTPGYTAVSRVLSLGSEVTAYKQGDIIFHYGSHSRYERISKQNLIIPIPENIPLQHAPFIRLATIAMTALRTSSIELGDYVAVSGLGLVGLMASQLAALQGAQVISIDPLVRRLELARACGISSTINSSDQHLESVLQQLTNGQGITTWIEATGVPQVVESSSKLIAAHGELILLGSPRGEHISNVTELLNSVHLVERGCITLKGAHEWKYPIHPQSHVKHSLVRNSQIALGLIQQKKLLVEPMITHILDPLHDAKAAYDGLVHEKQNYFGVLFQWSQEIQ